VRPDPKQHAAGDKQGCSSDSNDASALEIARFDSEYCEPYSADSDADEPPPADRRSASTNTFELEYFDVSGFTLSTL
jgi:hypothetical protein